MYECEAGLFSATLKKLNLEIQSQKKKSKIR